MSILSLIFTILLCPLAAFAIFGVLGLMGKRSPSQDLISTAAMLIAFVCSLLLFGQVLTNPDLQKPGGQIDSMVIDWITIGSLKFKMGFMLDSVTAVMLIVVTLVSCLVHIFSRQYMHGDPRYPRFFAFLSLFSFSMLLLIVSDNLLGIYIGWELVGLCSYLLIGFWFEKDSAADACKKAFLTTRVGDVGMFIGMMMLFAKFKTLSLFGEQGIFEAVSHLGSGDMLWLSVAGILIFCGPIGKSAQFPLHTWLPDAMEGPTPVSALIHAATMVAAGVYLTARMFPILTPESSLFIAYIGGITAIFAASIAIVRWDIKRVLAYSTISQLGYMMLAIGAGNYMAGLFHLTTHAFFKALLFLGSGSVIHALHVHHSDDDEHAHDEHHHHGPVERDGIPPEQDMRNMGGLRHKMPTTFWTMLIATLSISGVPFITSGFYSKDAVLGGVLGKAMEAGQYTIHYYILFGIALFAAMITAFYMFRLVFLTFFGQPKSQEMYDHAHESPSQMVIPLVILMVLSFPVVHAHLPFNISFTWSFDKLVQTPHQYHNGATGGHNGHSRADEKLTELYAAAGKSDYGSDSKYHDPHHDVHHKAHNIAMICSIIVAGLGILISWLIYGRQSIDEDPVEKALGPFHAVLWNKYYVDELYNGVVVKRVTLGLANVFGKIDINVVDGIVNAVAWITRVLIAGVVGLFDMIVIDGIVVTVVGKGIRSIGNQVRRIQTGTVQNYLAFVLGGVILLILLFYLLPSLIML